MPLYRFPLRPRVGIFRTTTVHQPHIRYDIRSLLLPILRITALTLMAQQLFSQGSLQLMKRYSLGSGVWGLGIFALAAAVQELFITESLRLYHYDAYRTGLFMLASNSLSFALI